LKGSRTLACAAEFWKTRRFRSCGLKIKDSPAAPTGFDSGDSPDSRSSGPEAKCSIAQSRGMDATASIALRSTDFPFGAAFVLGNLRLGEGREHEQGTKSGNRGSDAGLDSAMRLASVLSPSPGWWPPRPGAQPSTAQPDRSWGTISAFQSCLRDAPW